MGKRNDLTGKRFGNLTVIEYESTVNGKAKWKCLCDCGKETVAFAGNLIKGHTTSCGCAKGTGVIGGKYGKLTVLACIEGTSRYLCRCDCGEEVERDYKTLTWRKHEQCCDVCCKEKRAEQVREKAFFGGTQPSKILLDKEPSKANKSGVVGVNWDKARGKWQASIRFKGKKYNLGRFEYIQDAIDARKKAEEEIFGDFLKWYERFKESD